MTAPAWDRHEGVTVVECPDCAFCFDADHEDEHGGHSCPACAEIRHREALDLVDTPYPIEVFPERTDEQRDAIFAAMRAVDKYATEWFYAHVARERGRVAREWIERTSE